LYFILDYYYNPLWEFDSRNRDLVAAFLGAPLGQRKKRRGGAAAAAE
jgi:hypothetical protein